MLPEIRATQYKGVPASPGIIIGRAIVLDRDRLNIKPVSLPLSAVEQEISDFKQALERTKEDLAQQSVAVAKRLGPDFGRIFEAQRMIADDQVLNERVVKSIREKHLPAAYLYYQEVDKVIQQLSQSTDSYLKERIFDINSVSTKLISLLQGVKKTVVEDLQGPTVVIARYLAPGDLLGFSARKKVGFAMELGGVTSHTCLLAKSLNFPAIVGLGRSVREIKTGDRIIMDGYAGKLHHNPDKHTILHYRKRLKAIDRLNTRLSVLIDKPARTKDGRRVVVFNNIELPGETARVMKSGAEGIGLFRTEYLFLSGRTFPDFERQFRVYKAVLGRMKNSPVIIRTFDMGGDKFVSHMVHEVDPNPFLGWRAIRFCLDHPEIFKVQLKALLKAATFGNLRIMLPMISNFDELAESKKLIEECRRELEAEGTKVKKNVPLGIMIEVPSAVLIAEHLAKEVDFFSIGTNDLIQYALAVDRTNEMLTHLYQSFHPAVLHLIKQTIEAGHKSSIKVGICGELASDPYAVLLLVGMGIDELSTNYLSTAAVKQIVRNIDSGKAREIAGAACRKKTAAEVEELVRDKVQRHFPELVSLVDHMRGANNGG